MQQSGNSAIFVKVTPFNCGLTTNRFVSRFCPHLIATTMPFGFHFRIQRADIASTQSEKRCWFSVPAAPPPHMRHLELSPLWQRQIQLVAARSVGPAASKWVSFSDLLVSSPSQQEQLRIHPGTGFCTPQAGSSIAASTKAVSAVPAETTYEDQPLTFSALLLRPALEGEGEPCGGCLRPWLAVKPVGTVPCILAPLYTVCSPCI